MGSPYQVSAETLRSVAFGSITNAFVALGTALANPARLVCFTNTTDTEMLISVDATNAIFVIPKNSYKLFDLTANRRSADLIFAFRAGTQFYIKYVSAPGSGNVYIEVLYGDAGS